MREANRVEFESVDEPEKAGYAEGEGFPVHVDIGCGGLPCSVKEANRIECESTDEPKDCE